MCLYLKVIVVTGVRSNENSGLRVALSGRSTCSPSGMVQTPAKADDLDHNRPRHIAPASAPRFH